jgi:hypothetical protein
MSTIPFVRTRCVISLLLLPFTVLFAGEGDIESRIRQFEADYGSMTRTYPHLASQLNGGRVEAFLQKQRAELGTAVLSTRNDTVDYLLLMNHLDRELALLKINLKRLQEIAPLLPFAETIIRLDEERRAFQKVQPEQCASELNRMLPELEKLRESLHAKEGGKRKEDGGTFVPTPVQGYRAARECRDLRRTLKDWYSFYDGYDPLFTWWVESPYKRLEKALGEYADFLRSEIAGVDKGDRDAIIGDPIGREALLAELRTEMIAYTPEELIQIAEKEYAWCEREMKRASNDLGYGDEWLKAVEHVKTLHRAPGEQPELIRELAEEAVDFLETRDLLTIPPLARETWRMDMMSAERQKVSPFFTGGEVISIAFPLDSMQHEQKMMSFRGNNIHFSRATVHHELIPGHHLQGFMMDRYRTYRQVFWTPFWVEGWALYWEMQLWDLGFPRSAEDRVGMLFWRMHRCARIIFSLNFHLGKMSPQECIDLLVNRVGHELDNATAEVRRSFAGDYPPLYQIAYMVGALQFRALYRDFVETGTMSPKDFHDRILKGNIMNVEMVRLLLGNMKIDLDFTPGWRFYGEVNE